MRKIKNLFLSLLFIGLMSSVSFAGKYGGGGSSSASSSSSSSGSYSKSASSSGSSSSYSGSNYKQSYGSGISSDASQDSSRSTWGIPSKASPIPNIAPASHPLSGSSYSDSNGSVHYYSSDPVIVHHYVAVPIYSTPVYGGSVYTPGYTSQNSNYVVASTGSPIGFGHVVWVLAKIILFFVLAAVVAWIIYAYVVSR